MSPRRPRKPSAAGCRRAPDGPPPLVPLVPTLDGETGRSLPGMPPALAGRPDAVLPLDGGHSHACPARDRTAAGNLGPRLESRTGRRGRRSANRSGGIMPRSLSRIRAGEVGNGPRGARRGTPFCCAPRSPACWSPQRRRSMAAGWSPARRGVSCPPGGRVDRISYACRPGPWPGQVFMRASPVERKSPRKMQEVSA